MWSEFDRIIGYSYLSGMHLNDSKKELGTRVDRHDSVGKGTMGMELFHLVMNDPHLDNIPIILETPDESLWAQEIAQLYSFIK
jgi:probable endonuclease 4